MSEWNSAFVGTVVVGTGLVFTTAAPGAGPLGLCTGLACLHAAWSGPAVGRGSMAWALLWLVMVLPVWGATGYGHPWSVRVWALALIAVSCVCGFAGRRAPRTLYLSTVALLFGLPFFLGHLVSEFGNVAYASVWEALSPILAAQHLARPEAPVPAILALLVWPVAVLAWPKRRR